MRAITYRNTKTEIPRFDKTVHLRHNIGYAYETDTHFVHIYGKDVRFYVVSVGLTVIEKKDGSLQDWVKRIFGAENIQELNIDVGHSIDGVWRPSLYYQDDIYQALNCSNIEMRIAEQSLRLLIEKLDELFVYIEPDMSCLNVFSHKTRELLILACTEVENSWKSFMDKASTKPMNGKTFTTKDYVKLVDKLYLKEYQFRLKAYSGLPNFNPFNKWNSTAPSTSLSWYDDYNKTKHDRTTHFSKATLSNCISAVVANLIMHCVRFSPFPMLEQTNLFSSLINQHFEAELSGCDPKTFYLHDFTFPTGTRNDLFVFDPRKQGWAKPFTIVPLKL